MHDKISSLIARIESWKPYFVRDGRLRSGWRVALYTLASFATLLLFGWVFGLAVASLWMSRGISFDGVQLLFIDFSTRPFNYPDVAIPYIIGRTLVPLGVIWLFRKRIDKRPFLDLGFARPVGWRREFGIGFAISAGAWVVIFLLALLFGAVQVTNFSWNTRGILPAIALLALGLFFNLLVGLVEEADARGYILQNLAEGIGLQRAIIVSSFYFAALHLFNPGGAFSTPGIFVAGIWLALGYVITKRLWFSIGMHAAWNFIGGSLFGFRISGLNLDGVLELKITGADWLMGGAFGPEAGLLAILVEIAMMALLMGWKRDRLASVKQYFKSLSANISSQVKDTLSTDQVPDVKAAPSAKEIPVLQDTSISEPVPAVEPTPSATPVPAVEPTPSATPVPAVEPTPSATPAPDVIPTPPPDQVPAVKRTQSRVSVPAKSTPSVNRSPFENRPKSNSGRDAGFIGFVRAIGLAVKEFFEVFFAGWGKPPFR